MGAPTQVSRRRPGPLSLLHRRCRRHRGRPIRRPAACRRTSPWALKRTMAMSSKRLLIAASAALGLAACNTANTHIGDEDAFFGEAVRYNAAVQTINPEPVYAE